MDYPKLKRLNKKISRRISWEMGRLCSIKQNKIIFSSYEGRGYGDNLKYIAEKLKMTDKDCDLVWLVKNKKEAENVPPEIRTCLHGSSRAIYELSTARVWVDNCRKSVRYKKKDQLYIQTWHGGGAQKKCEKDAIEVLGPEYEIYARKDAATTDLMISESRFMTDLYHSSFWYDGPVYECGYPRYDILLREDPQIRDRVYNFYGIDPEKKLVLYAPTFRADKSFDAYNIDFIRLLKNLKKRFQKDFVAMIHLHPNVANLEGGIQYDGINVINCTFYPDTQELISAASVLIGDYSSINYDFSLKKQPVFRYASDLAEYQNDRDLYFPFNEYPYPWAQNNDELEKLILDFNEEEYLNILNAFFKKLGTVRSPDASDKIANLILDYLHSDMSKEQFINNNKAIFQYKDSASPKL